VVPKDSHGVEAEKLPSCYGLGRGSFFFSLRASKCSRQVKIAVLARCQGPV